MWSIVLTLLSCSRPDLYPNQEVNFSLSDRSLQKLISFQDQQNIDSLRSFLGHPSPTLRYGAAMAFASCQDSSVLDKLVLLLQDPVEEVRTASAYAIGQIGSKQVEKSLVASFEANDSTGVHGIFNRTVLEAVGKSASKEYLNLLASVTSYSPADTLLLEGLALGIYRFSLRKLSSAAGTQRMVDLSTDSKYPMSVRNIASNYLSRIQNQPLDSFYIPLIRAFQGEDNPYIRMNLANAMGNIRDTAVIQVLRTAIRLDKDYRVRVNAVRAYSNFPYVSTSTDIFPLLKNPNHQLSFAASEFFLKNGSKTDGSRYWRIGRDTSIHWRTALNLFKAANKHTPPYFETTLASINAELRRRFFESTNVYEKMAVLDAMSANGWNYTFIIKQGLTNESPIVRTAAIAALRQISNRPDFDAYFAGSRKSIRRVLANTFSDGITLGDAGQKAEAAMAIAQGKDHYRDLLQDSLTSIRTSLESIPLPNEIESYNEIVNALNQLGIQPQLEKKIPDFSHPIDWRVVNTIPQAGRAIIMTNKGQVTIDLKKEAAPATVANFVMLVRAGYYDNKPIHRVVPNFVVQGGCSRGDGYGSLDYTIRSELGLSSVYDTEGMVGMASAGQHTECTQFFITHSPARHLDGRYTVFGQVTQGMDVVHDIQIGDLIERIIIQ